ncbi:MAG: NAD(P)H-hydrate dehydratase [Eubacteriaceae bacterium]|nr:NAD(P)H-hydrate dehydratase [Eubacteriaceae bacterium]
MIYTGDEMRYLDNYTIKNKGVSSILLMENAAEEIFKKIKKNVPSFKKTSSVTIVSGTGNNGGDGLALARLMQSEGYKVKTVITGSQDKMTSDTAKNYRRLSETGAEICFYGELKGKAVRKILDSSDYIIDGIFGSGLDREVTGEIKELMELINSSEGVTISIDIPSGIMGNSGKAAGIAVKADFTVVVEALKTGNLLNDAADHSGEILVTDSIGIDRAGAANDKELLTSELVGKMKCRRKNSHKYDFGKLLVTGGAPGMTGAPLLCAMAGLRTGCGLSAAAIHQDVCQYTNNPWPQLMVFFYNNKWEYEKMLDKTKAVVFGPGLGQEEKYDEVLIQVLERNIPVVIDADGIFRLNSIRDKVKIDNNKIIITPHTGEIAKLFRITAAEVEEDPVCFVKLAVQTYNVSVILKGPCTIIADEGKMFFSYKPNSGMATAGSGDVLSGIVGGLLAQGYSVMDAMKKGVYLHSTAGYIAAEEKNEWSMTAVDILDNIHCAIEELGT